MKGLTQKGTFLTIPMWIFLRKLCNKYGNTNTNYPTKVKQNNNQGNGYYECNKKNTKVWKQMGGKIENNNRKFSLDTQGFTKKLMINDLRSMREGKSKQGEKKTDKKDKESDDNRNGESKILNEIILNDGIQFGILLDITEEEIGQLMEVDENPINLLLFKIQCYNMIRMKTLLC